MSENKNDTPDWKALSRIGDAADREAKRGPLTPERWRALYVQALKAARRHGEFTEFVALCKPPEPGEQ